MNKPVPVQSGGSVSDQKGSKFGRIGGLEDIVSAYDTLLCDVWGVLHNGVTIYPAAAEALSRFRAQGGRVVMITNSPRPKPGVVEQLAQLGASADVYDDIVTSGDVTRDLIRQVEGTVFHVGPERDVPLFDGLSVRMANDTVANALVCTGLFKDETESPEDYRERFAGPVARGVPFICANPDIVVERGDRLIWCAGALAQLYQEMGGEVRLAGKPHKPIYDLAMKKLAALDPSTAGKSRVLAVGDGMPTDVAGALGNGFDLLYISAGIHAAEYAGSNKDHETPNEARLNAFLAQHNASPSAWMPRLTWDASAQ
ncbi:MAG: TIGR01459 family HAD-type hydrolase [Pseudomonadota bacterium]